MSGTVEYKSKLHSILAAGPNPTREFWKDAILTYLTQNCKVTDKHPDSSLSSYFPSPLPVNVAPSSKLLRELTVTEHGDTALFLAIRAQCPSEVISALCQLCPQAASVTNKNGQLPLHHATKRPTGGTFSEKSTAPGSEALKTIGILLEVHPDGIIKADIQGKTPLHTLLEHHAESRNAALVEMFCRPVDEKVWKNESQRKLDANTRHKVVAPIPSIIRNKDPTLRKSGDNLFTPASAAAIPDAVYGCLPLHYAVMNGAPKEVVQYLIKTYPASIIKTDCHGRTALHWTLGAGGNDCIHGNDDNEDNQANRVVLHHTFRSGSVISMLLDSDASLPVNVASLQDQSPTGKPHRTCLHYAIELLAKNMLDPPPNCDEVESPRHKKNSPIMPGRTKQNNENSNKFVPCISLKILKQIIESYKPALVTKDGFGQTPLHVLFRTAHEWNEDQYIRALQFAQTGRLDSKGLPKPAKMFTAPPALVDILMQSVHPDDYEEPMSSGSDDNDQSDVVSVSSLRSFLSWGGSYDEGDKKKEQSKERETKKHHDREDLKEEFPAEIRDDRGLLPIHCATLAVSSPAVLKMLLEDYPNGLIQASFDGIERELTKHYDNIPRSLIGYNSSFSGRMNPLHFAFASPYAAMCQTEKAIETLLHFSIRNKSSDSEDDDRNPPNDVQGSEDGTLALKEVDLLGRTPLHLAVENHASIPIIGMLIKHYPAATTVSTKSGDLPLHLLLDKEYLFVSSQLAMAHYKKRENLNEEKQENNLFSNDESDTKGKIKDLARKQTCLMRMSQFNLNGALFAPSSGWTSDEEEKNRKQEQQSIYNKLYMLLRPILGNAEKLACRGSVHGMLPLHIAVAFHVVPYKDIHRMLQDHPQSARCLTEHDGYSPLDLHCIRVNIPGEVNESEKEAWEAVKQLLFSYEVFPLSELSLIKKSRAVNICRKDDGMIDDCIKVILQEIDNRKTFHKENEYIGGRFTSKSRHEKQTSMNFSDVIYRLWTFLTTFTNNNDSSDHYAIQVEKLLHDLDFALVDKLVNLPVLSYGLYNSPEQGHISTGLNIRDCANVFCRAVIHSNYYFAGLYDFSTPSSGSSLLLHRGNGGRNVIICATENAFFVDGGNTNKQQKEHKNAEEGLEVDLSSSSDGPASSANSTVFKPSFQVTQRFVCIKFMLDRVSYEKEVNLRSALAATEEEIFTEHITPILTDYDSTSSKRQQDLKYATDRMDPRFKKIALKANPYGPTDWLNLMDYPYAIVLPLSTGSNLKDSITHGVLDMALIKEISLNIGSTLSSLHRHGLIHGNVSLRNVIPFQDAEGSEKWKLTDLSSIIPSAADGEKVGLIKPNGTYTYESSILPPEMFAKLSPTELSRYEYYWKSVQKLDYVNIPQNLIKPQIDPVTDEAYVMKCFCKVKRKDEKQLPELPYDLISPSEALDLWSFGCFLFTLLSEGETFVHSNIRNGKISDIRVLADWDVDSAETLIYQHITDPIAQDLLLHVLVPIEMRSKLDLETVLSHPYFSKVVRPDIKDYLEHMKQVRKVEGKSRRTNKVPKRDENYNIVSQASTTIARLGVESQLKLVNSPTQIIIETYDLPVNMVDTTPIVALLLPYKLVRNKAGKLTPSSKSDVEMSERFGNQILTLSKVLSFAKQIEHHLKASNGVKDLVRIVKEESNPEQSLLQILQLDRDAYINFASELTSSIKETYHEFLSGPTKIIDKLIQASCIDILSLFEESDKAYLYLVDEFNGVPIVDLANRGPYPYVFNENIQDRVIKILPLMHTCFSYARASYGGIQGLVKLIFEAAYPHVPPSWSRTGKGLSNNFNRTDSLYETKRLLDLVSHDDGSLSGVQTLHSILKDVDKENKYSGLKLVSDGKSKLWTTVEGTKKLLKESEKETNPHYLERLVSKMDVNDNA